MSFDLDERRGWPDEWLVLLERHPRDTWRTSSSAVAHFWLERHDAFRRQGAAVAALAGDYRTSRLTPAELAARSAPVLWSLLAPLDGHHQIEDFHYFPYFRETEPRLAAGFESLERDHVVLHASIEDVVRRFNALTAAAEQDAMSSAQHRAADAYIDASLQLERRLTRHLDDEEDLVIPVMLERG